MPQRRHGRPWRSNTSGSRTWPPPVARVEHERPHRAHRFERLGVRHLARRPPRVEAGEKHASDFHRFPIPHRLRWSSRASPIPRSGRPRAAGAGSAFSSSSSARMSGPSAASRGRSASAIGHQLEHGAAELDHLVLGGADHEPRAARRPSPPLPAPVHAPPAVHAEVRVERQVAVEADEEVLALRVHRPDGAPGEPLRPAVAREARMRGLDRPRSPCRRARRGFGRPRRRSCALGHAAEGSCPQLTRCRVSVPLPT